MSLLVTTGFMKPYQLFHTSVCSQHITITCRKRFYRLAGGVVTSSQLSWLLFCRLRMWDKYLLQTASIRARQCESGTSSAGSLQFLLTNSINASVSRHVKAHVFFVTLIIIAINIFLAFFFLFFVAETFCYFLAATITGIKENTSL